MAAAHHKQKHLTIVIKLGTSSIVDEKTHQPLLSILSLIVETAVQLIQDGHRVVIVSSGAIGVGLRRMDIEKRPKHLPQVQALAAIGQSRLMSLWDQLFDHVRQPVAQILLTRNDIADRTQYLNAQNTFMELLHMGVIPIVNENDTLAVTEIKFGDNDTLSAITAAMVQADYLFLMTDVDCLYDKNPRSNPDAKAIEIVEDISDLAADVSSAGSALGTGGMSTKIVAARLATSAGVTTVITKSSKPGNIGSIIKYAESQKQLTRVSSRTSVNENNEEVIPLSQIASLNLHNAARPASAPIPDDVPARSPTPQPETPEKPPLHTRFLPIAHPIRDRFFWILHGLAPHGTIYIDQGAFVALGGKAGLLPAGIVDADGHFAQQEAVRLVVVKRLPAPSTSTTNPHQPSAGVTQSQPPTPGKLSHPHPVQPPLIHGHSFPNAHSHPHSHHGGTPGTTTPVQVVTFELQNPAPFEVGRAVVNYSAAEIRRIKGLHSTQIGEVLGYADSEYVAFKENIALFGIERSRPGTPAFGKAGGERERERERERENWVEV